MVPVLAQLKAVLIKASGPDSATRSRGRVEKSLGDGVYVISSSDGKMTVQVKEKSLALHDQVFITHQKGKAVIEKAVPRDSDNTGAQKNPLPPKDQLLKVDVHRILKMFDSLTDTYKKEKTVATLQKVLLALSSVTPQSGKGSEKIGDLLQKAANLVAKTVQTDYTATPGKTVEQPVNTMPNSLSPTMQPQAATMDDKISIEAQQLRETIKMLASLPQNPSETVSAEVLKKVSDILTSALTDLVPVQKNLNEHIQQILQRPELKLSNDMRSAQVKQLLQAFKAQLEILTAAQDTPSAPEAQLFEQNSLKVPESIRTAPSAPESLKADKLQQSLAELSSALERGHDAKTDHELKQILKDLAQSLQTINDTVQGIRGTLLNDTQNRLNDLIQSSEQLKLKDIEQVIRQLEPIKMELRILNTLIDTPEEQTRILERGMVAKQAITLQNILTDALVLFEKSGESQKLLHLLHSAGTGLENSPSLVENLQSEVLLQSLYQKENAEQGVMTSADKVITEKILSFLSLLGSDEQRGALNVPANPSNTQAEVTHAQNALSSAQPNPVLSVPQDVEQAVDSILKDIREAIKELLPKSGKRIDTAVQPSLDLNQAIEKLLQRAHSLESSEKAISFSTRDNLQIHHLSDSIANPESTLINKKELRELIDITEKIIRLGEPLSAQDKVQLQEAISGVEKGREQLPPNTGRAILSSPIPAESGIMRFDTSGETVEFLKSLGITKDRIEDFLNRIAQENRPYVLVETKNNQTSISLLNVNETLQQLKQILSQKLQHPLWQELSAQSLFDQITAKGAISIDHLQQLDSLLHSLSQENTGPSGNLFQQSSKTSDSKLMQWLGNILHAPKLSQAILQTAPLSPAQDITQLADMLQRISPASPNPQIPQMEKLFKENPFVSSEFGKQKIIPDMLNTMGITLERSLAQVAYSGSLSPEVAQSLKAQLLRMLSTTQHQPKNPGATAAAQEVLLQELGQNLSNDLTQFTDAVTKTIDFAINQLSKEIDTSSMQLSRPMQDSINSFKTNVTSHFTEAHSQLQTLFDKAQSAAQPLESVLNETSRIIGDLRNAVQKEIEGLQRTLEQIIQNKNSSSDKESTPREAALATVLKNTTETMERETAKAAEKLDSFMRNSQSFSSGTTNSAVRNAIESALQKLESLQVLAKPNTVPEGQQQILALPVRVGNEWTEVQVRFIKNKNKKQKPGASESHYSVSIDVAPSITGQTSIDMEYFTGKSLVVYLDFEHDKSREWFQNNLTDLQRALQKLDLPPVSVQIRPPRQERFALAPRPATVHRPPENTDSSGNLDIQV